MLKIALIQQEHRTVTQNCQITIVQHSSLIFSYQKTQLRETSHHWKVRSSSVWNFWLIKIFASFIISSSMLPIGLSIYSKKHAGSISERSCTSWYRLLYAFWKCLKLSHKASASRSGSTNNEQITRDVRKIESRLLLFLAWTCLTINSISKKSHNSTV